MDRIKETSFVIKQLNKFLSNQIQDYEFIQDVCAYFDLIKDHNILPSEQKFLKYISNIAGIPHYYDLLFSKFGHKEYFDSFDLNTIASMIYESTLHVDENIKIHKYQKEILKKFNKDIENRFFLSATTSFGKTFLIYEIIKKMQYKNIALIFPTIALLSENYEKIMLDNNYNHFHQNFDIHTLSEVKEVGENNLFVFTPERYLSFIDKHSDFNLDFVFVDEIYKIDNEYLIDSINKENERDTAYRVALHHILSTTRDVLLVGPYIEFPDPHNNKVNQSFNMFLNRNHFHIIDYNKFDIVNKSYNVIERGLTIVDDFLTIDLRGYSKVGDRIGKLIYDIRQIGENSIIYAKGPSTAEKKANEIISFSTAKDISEPLQELIQHLKSTFKLDDWSLIRALKNRIGIHHGLIPKYIQKEIINLFNNGDIDVLISTTTITEGVNTSAKNLIVLSASKGNKALKTFDAKNIAGRAGRFLHHYSGRVLIYNKKFQEILDGTDNEIKHKNYDEQSQKDELDYFITDDDFLKDTEIKKRNNLKLAQEERIIPNKIMQMYKVVSYTDKMTIYDIINTMPANYLSRIKTFIKRTSYNLSSIDYQGFEVILLIIRNIITNDKLLALIDRKVTNSNGTSSLITNLLYFYLKDGFAGSVKYKISAQQKTTDEAIRETSNLVYNLFKFQLVKYLGVFNIMYKFVQSQKTKKEFEDIIGIDKLLMKLEYNATSEKGRLASDYGVPNKIIEFYDHEENQKIRKKFDSYEESKFQAIENILNN